MRASIAAVVVVASGVLAIAQAACRPPKDEPVAVPDAGPPDPAVVARGEYLVKSVAGCGECHTPRDATGKPDMTRWLAGAIDRFDVVPDDDTKGAISAPNLTPHVTGLLGWNDAEIKNAMLNGVTDLGKALYPVMPYYTFHNMTDDDATAIVVYLRTIPAIENVVPDRQPLPAPFDKPAAPVPETAIPHTTLTSKDPNFARAERGRYLAGSVGFCMDCHSTWRAGSTVPLDTKTLFGGGRAFSAKEWSVTSPDGGTAPSVIYGYNITPHASGIEGWNAPMVATLLTKGLDDEGLPICRPMPSGPMGAFGGLTAGDALDLGVYITTLPPIESDPVPGCPR